MRKTKPGKSKPRLVECDPSVPTAAWTLLRWCVGSCTAYLEPITSPGELIGNVGQYLTASFYMITYFPV